MMSKKQKSIVVQILVCIAFMLQPVILPSQPFENGNLFFSKEMMTNFLANALIIGFFYINYFYLISRLLFSEKYFLYFIAVFISLLVIVFLPMLLFGHYVLPPKIAPPNLPHHNRYNYDASLFTKFQFFFTGIDQQVFLFMGIVFFSIFWREKMKNKIIENEKLLAELSHLKLQIHPHFLFNTLNSIYAFAIRKDDKTAETVLKLADFMRYLLQDSYQDEVFLDKEIHYITNYIDLQKSRLRDTVNIKYEANDDFSGKKIAPLLLFTFIENAFKYGVNPEENSVITIFIQLTDNQLVLDIFNNIVSTKNIESTNIGIQNTKERLELYYPKKHQLVINHDKTTFQVQLKIELK